MHAGDLRHQSRPVERFQNEIADAGAIGAFKITRIGFGHAVEDLRADIGCDGFELGEKVQRAHRRKMPVKQNYVGHRSRAELKGFLGRCRLDGNVAHPLDNLAGDFANDVRVVNDKAEFHWFQVPCVEVTASVLFCYFGERIIKTALKICLRPSALLVWRPYSSACQQDVVAILEDLNGHAGDAGQTPGVVGLDVHGVEFAV